MSDAPPPPPRGPRWGGGRPPDGGLPPPGWAGHTPPPQRRRRIWPWVLLGLFVLFVGGCVAVIATVSTMVDDDSNRTVTVRYAVTGDAKDGVTIAYTTWKDGNSASNTVSDARLPWHKEVGATGLVKAGSLTVTTGASGGTVTCSLSVDGDEPQTATATGRFATATCDDF